VYVTVQVSLVPIPRPVLLRVDVRRACGRAGVERRATAGLLRAGHAGRAREVADTRDAEVDDD